MMVGGCRLGEAFGFHHDKRDAVRQRPGFVGTARVELQPTLQLGLRRRHDVKLGGAQDGLHEACGPRPIGRRRERIAHFRQDPAGGEQRSAMFLGESHAAPMRLIERIGEAEQKKRVGKHALHRRGVP